MTRIKTVGEFLRYLSTERCPLRFRSTVSSIKEMYELMKAYNMTWRQAVAVYRERNVWIRILKNFHELEGSWPAALKKMALIFQGKYVKRPDGHP